MNYQRSNISLMASLPPLAAAALKLGLVVVTVEATPRTGYETRFDLAAAAAAAEAAETVPGYATPGY